MSYASDVKQELCQLNQSDADVYELKALLNMGSNIKTENAVDCISYHTTHPFIARRFLHLIKRFYDCEVELIQKKDNKLNRKHLYIVSVLNHVERIKQDMSIYNVFEKEKQKILNKPEFSAGYIRGAFLACGSVNNPQTGSYHLEISANNEHDSVFLMRVLNKFELNAKITKRKKLFIIYLKEGEKIVDALRIIGSTTKAFHFEDIRIKRDFNTSITRVINCEVANQTKTFAAAKEHLKYIQYLTFHYPIEKLDSKILMVMKARQENPEASLNELIEILYHVFGEEITKSGLNHRFRKIKELALEHMEKVNNKN